MMSMDISSEAMQKADIAQERMIEQNAPEPKRVQCDQCRGYENQDDTCTMVLCESCQNKLARYDRLIMALRNIIMWSNDDIAGEEAMHALEYCMEKP